MEFTEPPIAGQKEKSEKWKTIVFTLKENTREWALVGNYSPGVAAQIRQGLYKVFLENSESSEEQARLYMKQHWELTTRKTDKGRTDLYIRWLG